MNLPRYFSTLAVTVCLGFSTIYADEVYTVIDTSEPSENLSVSFEQGSEEGGWGWYFLDSAMRRDIAQSFEAPSSGSFDKITLKVRSLRGGPITEQPYRLRILETDSNEASLDSAREIASYQANLSIDPAQNFYMTFTLPKPVEIQSKNFYFIVLSWENSAHSNHVEFAVQNDYTMGSLWQNVSEGTPEYTRLTDSHRPGMIFYIH